VSRYFSTITLCPYWAQSWETLWLWLVLVIVSCKRIPIIHPPAGPRRSQTFSIRSCSSPDPSQYHWGSLGLWREFCSLRAHSAWHATTELSHYQFLPWENGSVSELLLHSFQDPQSILLGNKFLHLHQQASVNRFNLLCAIARSKV